MNCGSDYEVLLWPTHQLSSYVYIMEAVNIHGLYTFIGFVVQGSHRQVLLSEFEWKCEQQIMKATSLRHNSCSFILWREMSLRIENFDKIVS